MKIAALLAAFITAATAASATVTPLPGASPQTARAQVPFLEQIGVLVTDANGKPVPGAGVAFNISWLGGPAIDAAYRTFDCYPDLGWNCKTTADSQGVALLPGMWGPSPGRYTVRVSASDGAAYLGNTTLEFDVIGNQGSTGFKSLQDMWWGGPLGNGWGMSVVEHGAQLFNVVYAYDQEGKPTWWVMPTGTWTPSFMTSYRGSFYSPRSAPYFAYDASRFVAGAPAASGFLTFEGPDTTTLGMNFGISSVQFRLERMTNIGGESTDSNHDVGDMWWGGASQSGWGVSIIERNGVLFSVWLTYDADGKPTWFVMPGGTWTNPSTYTGPLIRTSGSAWVVGPYDPASLRAAATGTYTLHFNDARNATFDYSIDGRSGSLPLVRQAF